MIIPTFKGRTIPVYQLEYYISEEPSEEEKQFKLIHDAIKEFECLPSVEEMAKILEYESKALDYAFKLAINTLDERSFEREFVSIYNAVNDSKFYSTALRHDNLFTKYCTLQNILGELKVIHDIKDTVRELNFNYNYHNRQTLQALQDLNPDNIKK